MKSTLAHLIRSTVAGGVRLAIGLILGIGALAAPALTVHAGTASLTASQNPVVIPTGQSSAGFTLSWNTGNGLPADLYGSVNGGPDNGPYPAAAVGSSPETINAGESITYKLYTPKKAQLLATLKVTTLNQIVLPNPGITLPLCNVDCIKSVTVTPHGTFADFHIVATGHVKVVLEAHEPGKPTASGTFNLTQDPDWQTYLLSLKPNTKYLYTVKATDAENNTREESGSFTTLHRLVSVTITDIHIISEDDEEMHFYFNAGSFWDTGMCYPSAPNFEDCPLGEFDAGDTVHPNYFKATQDVGDTLTIMVQGVEDNCSGFSAFPFPHTVLCTNGLGLNPDQLNGAVNDTIWATAVGQIAIGSGNLHDEVYNDTFTITSPEVDYRFSASGTIKVDYVK
jgi:hypothetical protein